MPNIQGQKKWSSVRLLETHELARGGVNGNLNEQAQALADRTEFLNQEKADKEYVDQKITNAKEYDQTFDTEVELKAFIPTNLGFIAKSWDTHKVFKWEGESLGWKDLGLSQLDLANNYTDNILNGAKFKKGVNIADLSKSLSGHYVDYETGFTADQIDHTLLGPYEISANTEYKFPQPFNQQLAFYDADMNFISGLALPPSNKIIESPNSAKYIKITVPNNQLSSFMLCKANEYPASYTPYTVEPENILVSTDQIKNFNKTVKNVLGSHSVNIFNKENIELGYYYQFDNGLKGTATPSDLYCCSLINIKSATEYRVSPGYTQIAFYDIHMVYISGLAQVPSAVFTTPENAAYMGLTVAVTDLESYMLCESHEFPSKYLPHFEKYETIKLSSDQVIDLDEKLTTYVESEPLNIINTETVTQDKYVSYTDGSVGTNTDFVATDFLPVHPNTEYETSKNYTQQFAFFDEYKTYISGQATATPTYKFTTPSNAAYIRFSIEKYKLDSVMVTQSALFPDTYVPHGLKVAKNLFIESEKLKTNQIIASANMNHPSASFKGKNAGQLALDSIMDALANNRYQIKLDGFYKVDTASEVIGYPGYPSMILMKDHVDLIGDGNTVIWCELPYDDSAIGPSANGTTYPRTTYQTLYTWAHDSLIKGIKFVIKNGRYAFHLDNTNGANKTRHFEDVSFIFKGDKGSKQALGVGTSSGEKTYFTGGESHSDWGTPFYCHNNSKFTDPSVMSFKGHRFSSNQSKLIGRFESDGSLVSDKMEFIGCSFGGSAYVIEYAELWIKRNPAQSDDSFDHAEWKFTGYGNEPFLFDNQVRGYCLRFKTTATGLNNKIRFDKTSSGYPLIIKNNQLNDDVSLFIDSRDYVDGYIVQDGSVDLPAQAWGCLDLTETVEYSDGGIVYTSLAKRLGNCSINTKTLGVIINGITTSVIFNKDYSGMSNAQILTEINTQLSGVTADLYIYGRDYYAEMTDVIEVAFNNSSTFIPKGSVVTKSNGTVKLANGNDRIFGVTLDDIPVMHASSEGEMIGQGRVLKRGYIYANPGKAHFVKANVHVPAVGTKFSVVNGELVDDFENGTVSVDIDEGVISINC